MKKYLVALLVITAVAVSPAIAAEDVDFPEEVGGCDGASVSEEGVSFYKYEDTDGDGDEEKVDCEPDAGL